MAAMALCWERAETSSWSSRVTPNFSATFFGSDAHVIVIERIPQTILDHDIDEFAIAHT